MQRQLSEIERHSATAGETGQPTRADWTQQSYFVIDSLDELLKLAKVDFAPLYTRCLLYTSDAADE